jgi:hypothetical protein
VVKAVWSQVHHDSIGIFTVRNAELRPIGVTRDAGKAIVYRNVLRLAIHDAVIGYGLIFRQQQNLHRMVVDDWDL